MFHVKHPLQCSLRYTTHQPNALRRNTTKGRFTRRARPIIITRWVPPQPRSVGKSMIQTRKTLFLLFIQLLLGIVFGLTALHAHEPDRTRLPIPDVQYQYPGKVPLDARDAKFPP